MSAVGPISLNIFVPSMPGLQATFGATTGAVQLTLTVYIASIALCQLLYGPLSDRFGRRPLVLAGLALYVAASLACALAPSLEFLIAARGLQAIGGASGMILSRAIVRDLFERDKAASVLGYITMAWVVAPMIAPTIGGLLDQPRQLVDVVVPVSLVDAAGVESVHCDITIWVTPRKCRPSRRLFGR